MKKLKELKNIDKPREKLQTKGAKALKNGELMAILLRSGVVGKNVRKLAKEITALFDREFEEISLQKLTRIHGLGIAKASVILASIELSKRYLIKSNKAIKSTKDVYEKLKEYATKTQEYFLSITLDGVSHIIKKELCLSEHSIKA